MLHNLRFFLFKMPFISYCYLFWFLYYSHFKYRMCSNLKGNSGAKGLMDYKHSKKKYQQYTWTLSFKYTNKMQRYTIFFITVKALHVSGGFSAHHQELKTVHSASGIYQACLLLPLAWVSWNCSFELLMMGGETA